MSKRSKKIIFDVGNEFGNMNMNAKFYPENFTREDVIRAFNLSRELLGLAYGFDGRKLFMADQVDKKGSYFVITEDYVKDNPNGWSDIKEDILVMSDNVKGVGIGHAVADCPVVMAFDERQKVVSIGHCSAELVDKMLPMAIVDALLDAYGSKDEDISIYVSSGADKKSYTYDRYPAWATDPKVWDEMITEDENGLFHIDIKGAIKRQLEERNIDSKKIEVSKIDTITDPNFYSNAAVFQGHPEKAGRNFPGVVFLDDEQKGIRR